MSVAPIKSPISKASYWHAQKKSFKLRRTARILSIYCSQTAQANKIYDTWKPRSTVANLSAGNILSQHVLYSFFRNLSRISRNKLPPDRCHFSSPNRRTANDKHGSNKHFLVSCHLTFIKAIPSLSKFVLIIPYGENVKIRDRKCSKLPWRSCAINTNNTRQLGDRHTCPEN